MVGDVRNVCCFDNTELKTVRDSMKHEGHVLYRILISNMCSSIVVHISICLEKTAGDTSLTVCPSPFSLSAAVFGAG